MTGSRAFFGRRYQAPAYNKAARVETPVGAPCLYCGEPIAAGDDGWLEEVARTAGRSSPLQTIEAYHLECELLHLRGREFGICDCHGDEFEAWPARERAREVLRRLREREPHVFAPTVET